MDNRSQFTFYRSFWEAIKGLPKKDRLPILETIISYALDGTTPSSLSQSQFAFFLLVKPTLDAARKKAANGKQGGSKKEANDKQTESKPKQTESKKEKEKEKENEIEKEEEKEKEQTESNATFSGKPFTTFWDAYPKKIDRNGAWSAWKALNPSPETVQKIMTSLEAWKKTSQWMDGDRFVPSAGNFLSKGHWEHIPAPDKSNAPKGATGSLGAAEIENIRRLLTEG